MNNKTFPKNDKTMSRKEYKDPMGTAIADYLSNGKADTLRVFAKDFDEDEMPIETLFRRYEEMPELEQKALQMSKGKILDVGAGAGCHSLALQDMGKDVTAIDISPLSIVAMKNRGVKNAVEQDFFTVAEKYDTILMLMNGIGIVGTVNALPRFLQHIDNIMAPEGQLLVDSSDICYIFEEEDGIIYLPEGEKYYGEMEYQMQYKDIKGAPFPWLYIDFESLANIASEYGFKAEVIAEGEHYDYLARITRTNANC